MQGQELNAGLRLLARADVAHHHQAAGFVVAPLGQDRVLSTDVLLLADAIERGHFTAGVRAE